MATKKSAQTVRVACRLPHGIIVKLGNEAVKLHGLHSPYAVAGHGMTDVPTDVWDAIVMAYGERKFIKNGYVFALDADSARDKAIERKDVNAGFNPIDPRNPQGVGGIGVEIQPNGAPDRGAAE